MLDVVYYVTADGTEVLAQWLEQLRDRQAAAKVVTRIGRLTLGNFGDCKPVGAGVSEFRSDWGAGYRVYYGRAGRSVVLLLCGGEKSTQAKDIENAKAYFEDYKARAKNAARAKPPV